MRMHSWKKTSGKYKFACEKYKFLHAYEKTLNSKKFLKILINVSVISWIVSH